MCTLIIHLLAYQRGTPMYGRLNFLVGYTDHEVYKEMLKLTDSSWVNTTTSPSGSGEIVMSQENRMNGTCLASEANMTIEGNTARVEVTNAVSSFHLLPSCDGCLVFMINSTARNIKHLLKLMRLNLDVGDVIDSRSVYLLSKESALKESELEHFKQQASCLGFSGDPDFIYNPEKSFCAKGEGIKISM
uniref:Uncharacterized protein n=1 Tax=Amphilophus citrinellus TaxID=61819 RepID=A0A3Q0QQD2_AMPCI